MMHSSLFNYFEDNSSWHTYCTCTILSIIHLPYMQQSTSIKKPEIKIHAHRIFAQTVCMHLYLFHKHRHLSVYCFYIFIANISVIHMTWFSTVVDMWIFALNISENNFTWIYKLNYSMWNICTELLFWIFWEKIF